MAIPKKGTKKTVKAARKPVAGKKVARKAAVKNKPKTKPKAAKTATKKKAVRAASKKNSVSGKKTALKKPAPENKEKKNVSKKPAQVPVKNAAPPGDTSHGIAPIVNPLQKAFDKFTGHGDPQQHLRLSSKPKGGVKPSGKKPLWN